MHPKVLLNTCTELVALVLKLDHPADTVVSRYFREQRQLGPRERATLANTAYMVLRKKLLFEHLAPFGSGPRERRLAILGLAYSLQEQGQRTGQSSAAPPGDGLLQAALTPQESDWLLQCKRIQTDLLLERHRHNLPEWLVSPLKQQLGPEFWPLVHALDQTAPLDLRVNTLSSKREDICQELTALGIPSQPTPYSPWGVRIHGKPALSQLELFQRGAVEVQDEGSQLLALLVQAKRGDMVVDFCAGAGGKTLALGAAMRNAGRLYALDTSAHRLDALKPRLARSGLSNVHPVVIAHERDDRIKRLRGKIDKVLVDAPCSGLGTLRRNPDLKWRQSPDSVTQMAAKQLLILQSAARLLKPGARLVYATCSLLQAENEDIVHAFDAEPGYQPLSAADILTQLRITDAAALCAGGPDGGRFLRLWPHRHGTDGFFAAVWEKSTS